MNFNNFTTNAKENTIMHYMALSHNSIEYESN